MNNDEVEAPLLLSKEGIGLETQVEGEGLKIFRLMKKMARGLV